MRCLINFDKLINQLVPHYLGGRKLILYLQALLHPLQTLNDRFVKWAKETELEAAMTSQPILFERFLNDKFSYYFLDSSLRIVIRSSTANGLPFYYENDSEQGITHPCFYKAAEQHTADDKDAVLVFENDRGAALDVSFVVEAPYPDVRKIALSQYEALLKKWIDRYRVVGKSYEILYFWPDSPENP